MVQAQAQVNVDSLQRVAFDERESDSSRFEAFEELSDAYTQDGLFDRASHAAEQWEKLAQHVSNVEEEAKSLVRQGRVEGMQFKTKEAIQTLEKAQTLAIRAHSKEVEGGALLNLGIVYHAERQYEQAEQALSEALQFGQETSSFPLVWKSYHMLALCYEMMGNYSKAVAYYEKSIEASDKTKDVESLKMPLFRLGKMYNYVAAYEKALDAHQKSLALEREEGDKMRIAKKLYEIGIVYKSLRNFAEAIRYYQQAETLYESEESANGLRGRSAICGELCAIYSLLAEYETAFSYAWESLQIEDSLGSRQNFAMANNSVALAYQNLGQDSVAIAYFMRSINIFREEGNLFGVAFVLNNLGDLFIKTHRHDEALTYLQEALAVGEQIDSKDCIATSKAGIGSALVEQEKYRLAIPYLEEARLLSQELGLNDILIPVAQLLYKSYDTLGNPRKALDMYELHVQTRDSLNSEDNQRATIRYEFEKQALADSLTFAQEKAAAELAHETDLQQQRTFLIFAASLWGLLAILAVILYRNAQRRKRTNAILTEQKQQIEKKNAQNELLLKEIHHRVKNNLEIVSSLLELQSAQLDDAAMRSTMLQSQSRVQSMGIIHQKLYQGQNLAAIEMRDYFQNLGDYLLDSFDAHGRIAIEVEMEPLELDIDTAVPIGLIVNELLTNALKYAFPDGQVGHIEIALIPISDNRLYLTVSDDGIGKVVGQPAHGSGFGAQLIHLLTRQLKGSLHESVDQGTHVSIEVEKAAP